MIECVGEVAEVVLQRAPQHVLVGGVRLEGGADLGQQLSEIGKAGGNLHSRLDLPRQFLDLRLFLHALVEPALQSLEVHLVDGDPIVFEPLCQRGGHVQQNVLVPQVVGVEILCCIREGDIVDVRGVEVVPDTPQLGALAASAVSAEQVVPSGGGISEA